MNPEDFTIVMGTIGDDIHSIGLKLLEYGLTQEGYSVITLGVQVAPEEFLEAAVETNADCILISSLSGHAQNLCKGFGNMAREYGLDDVLLYVGGYLSVGVRDDTQVSALFKSGDYGFDRAYPTGGTLEQLLEDLERDLVDCG